VAQHDALKERQFALAFVFVAKGTLSNFSSIADNRNKLNFVVLQHLLPLASPRVSSVSVD